MSLFSVFDPVVGVAPVGWIVLGWVVVFLPVGFYVWGGGLLKGVSSGAESLFSDIGGRAKSGIYMVGVGVFMYLVLSNYLGLFFYIFTGTAHPLVSMGLGVVMWLTFFLMGWICFFSGSAGHLVPEGCPLVLSPVLVLIELVSHLMRPFTLSIRLAANMMAGHLIVGLLASLSELGSKLFMVSVSLQVIMLVLEWGVSVIQALVFGILVVLYAVEYY